MPSGGALGRLWTREVTGAVCALLALVLGACGDSTCGAGRDGAADAGNDAGSDAGMAVEPEVVIGMPDTADSLAFVALEAGGDIPLKTFGQGGTHAEMAVRTIGFGKRAYVVVTLENLVSGDQVMTPKPSRPQLLLCRDGKETTCDLIPFLVLTGGLADPSEKDGLRVRVTAEVRNADGLEAKASIDGVLRAE